MKYIVFSLLIASLTSCTPFWSKESTPSTPVVVPVVSESGAITQDGGDAPSLTGGTLSESGNNMTEPSVIPSVRPSEATGAMVQTGASSSTEKDPEVEKITQDIDKIFDDITKEGK